MKKSKVIKHNSNKELSNKDKISFFINLIAKYCDKCGTPYQPEDVRILKENANKSIIHFSCSKCKSTHIAQFIAPLGAISRVPINTDLKINEVAAFIGRTKISPNDVLEVYEILKKKKGSLQIML